ncbi:MAG: ABC transporter substrate-binding protein [Holophaga sp.]|nr:ABC transporter substrate-binding protein [Holophaga sp.]
MKKALTFALLPLLALAAQFGRAAEPIKIGQVVTLTGSNAPWGIPEHNALKDEIARINATGGLLGRQVQLIAYDYKGDQLEGVNVAKRLVGDGVCAIIGPGSSGTGIAMTAVTEAAGIPMMATSATNPKVTFNYDTKRPIRTAFRACFIDPFQGSVAAKFITSDLKAKRCAVIFDVGSDYSQGLDQYFREYLAKFGGSVVAREGYRSGEMDFRAILGKIRSCKPEVIYLPTDMTQAAMIMKQGRGLGLKCVFVSDDSCDTPDVLPLAGNAAEGAYFTNLTSLEDPTIKGWISAYRAKYGAEPILPNCVMAVDAMRAVAAAITKGKSAEPAKIIAQLENLKDVPVLTGKLTIDPATHNPINKPCVVETVQHGTIKYLKRFEKID